ncbi:MAG TPA: hypothetical protein VG406_10510, partial [Isosphaeraceae bacterium]|nr:hypothetical protein [Isosphaeraceae bacterium]
MNLNHTELKILKFIDRTFDVVFERADAAAIFTPEERPLATLDLIEATFCPGGMSPEEIEKVVKKLLSYKLVKSIHLHEPNEFVEVRTSASGTIRQPVACPPTGKDGFQITQNGKDYLANRPWEKTKRKLLGYLDKALEQYIGVIIGLILGYILGQIFRIRI